MDERLDTVERGLEAVARLTAATAKGQGKERTQRLVVVLATGVFRDRVTALVDEWNKGAEAARAGAGAGSSGGGDGRPPPCGQQLLANWQPREWRTRCAPLSMQRRRVPSRPRTSSRPRTAIALWFLLCCSGTTSRGSTLGLLLRLTRWGKWWGKARTARGRRVGLRLVGLPREVCTAQFWKTASVTVPKKSTRTLRGRVARVARGRLRGWVLWVGRSAAPLNASPSQRRVKRKGPNDEQLLVRKF